MTSARALTSCWNLLSCAINSRCCNEQVIRNDNWSNTSSSGYSTLPRCRGSGKSSNSPGKRWLRRVPRYLPQSAPSASPATRIRGSRRIQHFSPLSRSSSPDRPGGATGAPLCQQSTYSKRTRSSPTTTAKGCGLRHFCMFCGPNRNDEVFDARACAAVVYESLGQEFREDLSGLSRGLSTNIAAVPPWLAAW